MTRSNWKGPYVGLKNRISNNKKNYTNNELKIINRNIEITPIFINQSFKVYNGKNYFEVIVTDEMIGHKFGEFVFTRAKFLFKKKKSKK